MCKENDTLGRNTPSASCLVDGEDDEIVQEAASRAAGIMSALWEEVLPVVQEQHSVQAASAWARQPARGRWGVYSPDEYARIQAEQEASRSQREADDFAERVAAKEAAQRLAKDEMQRKAAKELDSLRSSVFDTLSFPEPPPRRRPTASPSVRSDSRYTKTLQIARQSAPGLVNDILTSAVRSYARVQAAKGAEELARQQDAKDAWEKARKEAARSKAVENVNAIVQWAVHDQVRVSMAQEADKQLHLVMVQAQNIAAREVNAVLKSVLADAARIQAASEASSQRDLESRLSKDISSGGLWDWSDSEDSEEERLRERVLSKPKQPEAKEHSLEASLPKAEVYGDATGRWVQGKWQESSESTPRVEDTPSTAEEAVVAFSEPSQSEPSQPSRSKRLTSAGGKKSRRHKPSGEGDEQGIMKRCSSASAFMMDLYGQGAAAPSNGAPRPQTPVAPGPAGSPMPPAWGPLAAANSSLGRMKVSKSAGFLPAVIPYSSKSSMTLGPLAPLGSTPFSKKSLSNSMAGGGSMPFATAGQQLMNESASRRHGFGFEAF
jgi:hypothetical protein